MLIASKYFESDKVLEVTNQFHLQRHQSGNRSIVTQYPFGTICDGQIPGTPVTVAGPAKAISIAFQVSPRHQGQDNLIRSLDMQRIGIRTADATDSHRLEHTGKLDTEMFAPMTGLPLQ